MKYTVQLLVFTFIFFFMGATVFAQFEDPRKWNMQVVPTGEPFEVPESHLKYQHPNTETRYYETDLGVVGVDPNFRVYPSVFTQSEVPITRHPFNSSIIYASSNSVRISPFFISEGLYLSTNQGLTWFGNDTTKSAPITNHGGDPAPAIDGNGRLYQSYLNGSFNGLYATYSTDLGTTWSNAVTLQSGSQDKNHTVVDNRPGSPYYGRVYVSWSRFTAASPPITVSWSSNGGVSWSAPQDVNTVSAGHYSQGVNGVIGPNGEVYMFYQNPMSSSPFTGDFMGMAKSTDGGVTWTFNNNIYDCNGIRGFLSNKASIRVNDFPWAGIDTTGGPRNGWIYVVHAEKNLAPAGSDPDIIMHRSTDGGATWSAGIRVNQDALNNGADQYMPALVVGADGSVNVVYYDSRFTSPDSAEVYVSRSTDGGDTWTDLQVSDHRFKPKPIAGLAGGYQGDYIGITETDGILWPYWCDDVTGIYQAWTTKVTFGPPCPVEAPSNPSPVNGATNVSIALTEITWDNGLGANTNDLYFGTNPGSLPLVQSGTLATSWTIPTGTLEYSSTYYWQVVEHGDTCSTAGPMWSFSTEADPNLITIFEDYFDTFDWTPVGPNGLTNWSTQNSSNAGGTPPELQFSWTPSFVGQSYLISPMITGYGGDDITVEFKHLVDWFSDPLGPVGLAITTDGGSTYTSLWEIQPTGNVGPETISIDFTAPGDFQFAFYYNGNSFNIDFWYIDNFVALTIIPVELSSFSANVADDQVKLNWTTATETNNQGFDIERKLSDGQFEKIGFVPGHGTTTEVQNYSFVDSKLSGGTYYYRLRQVDFNGSFEYSDEIEVEVAGPKVYSLSQNYPNPFNPSTLIKYSIPKDGFVSLTVYNTVGEKVATLINQEMKAGEYEVNFDASSLSSGVYFYRLNSGEFTSVKKMLLMR
ncbi:MAG: hypothetical protein Kow0098_27740 [Ignavibacteriaceae bacterium]